MMKVPVPSYYIGGFGNHIDTVFTNTEGLTILGKRCLYERTDK